MLIKRKICMVGAFAVGKTSMVRRFVESIFSEQYLSTVKVTIEKKTIRRGEDEFVLMLWDMAGEDAFQSLQMSYLAGAAGYLLVADGTRRATLEKALELQGRVQQTIGSTPFVAAINKNDLAADWEVTEEMEQGLRGRGWTVFRTSAKTGEGVEEAFQALNLAMLGRKP